MPFVEVFVPSNTLTDQQRTQLHHRLVAAVMEVEGAPDTPAARSISWLVLHEVDSWSVGGTMVEDGSAPLIIVRLNLPAGSVDDDQRARMMSVVNDLLVEIDGSERFRRYPQAWVHINEVPDGNWGAFGRVTRLGDIQEFVGQSAA